VKPFRSVIAVIFLISVPAFAQDAGGTTQDNSTTSEEQATKSNEAKGTSLIGCLSGPDSHGKYTLRSMSHRTGVEVIGPDELKNDSGNKVKLTGSWKPGDQPPDETKGKESRKFQATKIEVLADECQAPTEKTPVSKRKQQQQQQKSTANQHQGVAGNPQ
jgi:hypothetical protein